MTLRRVRRLFEYPDPFLYAARSGEVLVPTLSVVSSGTRHPFRNRLSILNQPIISTTLREIVSPYLSRSSRKVSSRNVPVFDNSSVALHTILLQKSKVAGRRIFREITKREAIADSYSVTHNSEIACECNVRRGGPPHPYTKRTSAASRISNHQCKTTFATESTQSDTSPLSIAALPEGLFEHLVRRGGRGARAAIPHP